MNNQFGKRTAGRLVSSLFVLSLIFACVIPEAYAEEDEEITQGQQQSSAAAEQAASDADKPPAKPTKTEKAEDDDGVSANDASSQQADPEGKNIKASPVTLPGHKVGASSPDATIAEKATDPSAILTQLTNFFWTEDTADDRGIANTYVFQPVLPLTGRNVLRPTLPIVTTGGMDGVTGLGDLFLLDLYIGNLKTAAWGVGPAVTLPTATSDTLGAGKWSAGPAFLYLYKGVPKNMFGLLIYNEWSFAGESDRADVNKMTFQPVWTGHLKWGYIGWTDLTATINWNDNNALSLPVGVKFGKVWMAKTRLMWRFSPTTNTILTGLITLGASRLQ